MVDDRGHVMNYVEEGVFDYGLSVEQAAIYCDYILRDGDGITDSFRCDEETIENFANYRPHQIVNIASPFWIDKYEVSNVQYEQCVTASICSEPDGRSIESLDSLNGYWSQGQQEFGNYPVMVTFAQARIFCENWRGGRLPTEQEWEYAARGTDERFWPWGNHSFENATDLANYDQHIFGFAQVDSFPKGVSPFGLHNMAGNVDEWVQSAPLQSASPSYPFDILPVRGGSSGDDIFGITTFSQDAKNPNYEAGFRCVVPVD
jgi:formylglycine-generating enzyme required for sulfatase activity